MYYEYWGLNKPPFDNVPDPSMYVKSHASVDKAILETLRAIEGGNEYISVIVGDVGVGKTLSLKMIIDSLDRKRYKMALVINPDISFIQLLREIIIQLTSKQYELKGESELLESLNEISLKATDEGKKILIFIDETKAIPPTNLENLRLLLNMQGDGRILFTIVLSGQMELAERLKQPKCVDLFQKIGTYNKINRLQSEALTKDYIETRLKLAGGTVNVFTDDAIGYLWKYSTRGTPRLINKVCKLSLMAGETDKVDKVTVELVRRIGERFERLTGPAIKKWKPWERVLDRIVPEQTKENNKKASISKTEGETRIPSIIEEAKIGKFKIRNINIPPHIVKQARSTTKEHQMKLAGVLAAETIKKYPQLKSSPSVDPVDVWSEVRDLILDRLRQEIEINET